MNNFKDKVITIDGDEKLKYYVLDEVTLNNKIYLSAIQLIDENTLSDLLVIISVSYSDGEIYFNEVNDTEILKNVFELLANKYSSQA